LHEKSSPLRNTLQRSICDEKRVIVAQARSVQKMRTCPDCLAVVKLQNDSPSSFWESLLQSSRIIRVKRCPNCNATVFVILSLYATSRKKLKLFRERAYWFLFIALLLIVGYVVFEAMMS